MKERAPSRTSPQGFTLIELLVVITIIAILAGLVLSTAGGIQKKAARDRARAEIAALSSSLESYKADYGSYPEATNNPSVLYAALVGTDTNLNPNKKVYFEPSKGITATTNYNASTNYFVDPFGQPYRYQFPGDPNKSGTNFFDLWSFAGASGPKTNDTPTNHIFWEKNW